MPRETKAQKSTRVGLMLGRYDEISRSLRKLSKEADELKEALRAEETGTYGDWVLGEGTPREILDQKAAKEALTKAGIPVPTTTTTAPVTVRPAAGK